MRKYRNHRPQINPRHHEEEKQNEDNHNIITVKQSGIEVIKLEYILILKIKRNDWPLADTCPQAANHCALFIVISF